jgi:hypothetical protein
MYTAFGGAFVVSIALMASGMAATPVTARTTFNRLIDLFGFDGVNNKTVPLFVSFTLFFFSLPTI